MFLLYLDDAGSVGNPDEKHFVLAGIAVHEGQSYWLTQSLDEVAQSTGHPNPKNLEFHGSHIRPGRKFWRSLPIMERRRVIRHGLASARNLIGDWSLFASVIDKRRCQAEDPVEYAFEQLCNRFDLFLRRKFQKGNKQKGLLVLDKSARETRLQSLATNFRFEGHRWGVVRNLSDVPFFVDSKATRVIQYADLVAYACWRKFEKADPEFFEVISDSFDQEGGVVHGLHHFKNSEEFCDCPACAPNLFSR